MFLPFFLVSAYQASRVVIPWGVEGIFAVLSVVVIAFTTAALFSVNVLVGLVTFHDLQEDAGMYRGSGVVIPWAVSGAYGNTYQLLVADSTFKVFSFCHTPGDEKTVQHTWVSNLYRGSGVVIPRANGRMDKIPISYEYGMRDPVAAYSWMKLDRLVVARKRPRF